MDSLIDDSSLDRCQRCIRCQRDKPVDPNQPIFWPSDLCPECLEDVRMTRMQDDLDERGNLWREFVGLVGDWFAEADFQPLSENHRDVLMAKHEAVLKFGAQKLHADDSHTSENFLAAVVTKDMSRCQRLWQPLVKQIAANHKMIADGIKPPTGPPADPKPDSTRPDSDSVANRDKPNRKPERHWSTLKESTKDDFGERKAWLAWRKKNPGKTIGDYCRAIHRSSDYGQIQKSIRNADGFVAKYVITGLGSKKD